MAVRLQPPNDQGQLRLRQVNVVRGEPDRRSRQLEPVLGTATDLPPSLFLYPKVRANARTCPVHAVLACF